VAKKAWHLRSSLRPKAPDPPDPVSHSTDPALPSPRLAGAAYDGSSGRWPVGFGSPPKTAPQFLRNTDAEYAKYANKSQGGLSERSSRLCG